MSATWSFRTSWCRGWADDAEQRRADVVGRMWDQPRTLRFLEQAVLFRQSYDYNNETDTILS
ncbi:hypothetical protein PLANTIT3_20086 [Plantibacter sp. T3]|nr:hypothetical protein PLANTIT3_20086 [Plantibacter sp. T3]